MTKMIIKNRTDMDDYTALELVQKSVGEGLISEGTYGEQYCFLISFNYGDKKIGVSADKRKTGTHTFTIWEMKK